MSDGNYVEYTLQRIEYVDHDRVRENVHMFRSDDELVEVTPSHIRIRKRLLTENQRKRARNS